MDRDELYDKYLRGDITEAEADALTQILREDPAAPRELVEHTADTVLLMRVGTQIAGEEPRVQTRALLSQQTGTAFRIPKWSWAAAVLLAFSVGIATYFLMPRSGLELATVSNLSGEAKVIRHGREITLRLQDKIADNDQVIVAPKGQLTFACIDDGSAVRCASETRLNLHLEGGNKRIRLESGSVACDVAAQAAGRTFGVQTPFGDVRVVGTVFSVDVNAETTRVDVSSGEVRVEHRFGNTNITPGNSVVIDEKGIRPWRKVVDADFERGDPLPPDLKPFFILSTVLQNPDRSLSPAPNVAVVENGRLELRGGRREEEKSLGLAGLNSTQALGADIAFDLHVTHVDGTQIGVSVNGDLLNGYRAIFNLGEGRWTGVQVDRITLDGQQLLAHNAEKIAGTGAAHHFRVEKSGNRLQIWVDNKKRIDESLNPLPSIQKTFSIFSVFTGVKINAIHVMTR